MAYVQTPYGGRNIETPEERARRQYASQMALAELQGQTQRDMQTQQLAAQEKMLGMSQQPELARLAESRRRYDEGSDLRAAQRAAEMAQAQLATSRTGIASDLAGQVRSGMGQLNLDDEMMQALAMSMLGAGDIYSQQQSRKQAEHQAQQQALMELAQSLGDSPEARQLQALLMSSYGPLKGVEGAEDILGAVMSPLPEEQLKETLAYEQAAEERAPFMERYMKSMIRPFEYVARSLTGRTSQGEAMEQAAQIAAETGQSPHEVLQRLAAEGDTGAGELVGKASNERGESLKSAIKKLRARLQKGGE